MRDEECCCPTYHVDTEKIQSPDLKKSSWLIHPYIEPFYNPLSGTLPLLFMSSTVHIYAMCENKIHSGKNTQLSFSFSFQQEAKQIWLPGFPGEGKNCWRLWWKRPLLPDTLAHWHTHTDRHTHTDGRGENSNRKGHIQSHPPSVFLCFSHPEKPCLCGCAQPPAALPRCIIVQSEAGERSARSTAPPISMWKVVMSQPWLHYPDLCVCMCVCVGLCLL